MIPKVGKTYRTRSGKLVKIMYIDEHEIYPVYGSINGGGYRYTIDGRYWSDGTTSSLDLVEEVVDTPPSPIQSVTTEQLVPGDYGKVMVCHGGAVALQVTNDVEELRQGIEVLKEILAFKEKS